MTEQQKLKKFETEILRTLRKVHPHFMSQPSARKIKAFEDAEILLSSEREKELRHRRESFLRGIRSEAAALRRPPVLPLQANAVIGLNRKQPPEGFSPKTQAELRRLRELLILQLRKTVRIPEGGFQLRRAPEQEKILTHEQIEALANEILETWDALRPPVDLKRIAGLEQIVLLEGTFDNDFEGRIEFFPEFNSYAIFYPRERNDLTRRGRFSLAHELAHYYIPSHRAVIRSGISHNTRARFWHTHPFERQADVFAAALLVPTAALKAKIHRGGGVLTLRKILDFSEKCEASAQATVFRYVDCTDKAVAAVVTERGRIRYLFRSASAKARGLFLRIGSRAPRGPTTEAVHRRQRICFSDQPIRSWFGNEQPSRQLLWEEATQLGHTGLVLTLLTLSN